MPSHLDSVEKTEYEKTTNNLQTAKNEVKNPATRHVVSPVSIDLLVPLEGKLGICLYEMDKKLLKENLGRGFRKFCHNLKGNDETF